MRHKAKEIADFLYDTRSQLYDIRLEALLKRWPDCAEEDFAAAFKIYAKLKLDDQLNGIINCCSGIPISIRNLVENYLKENNKHIKLNLGYYPYPDYEPMAFWGIK